MAGPGLGAGTLACALGAAGLAAAVAGVVVACEDDPHRRTSREQALGGTGGACTGSPGPLPEPNCDDSAKDCESRPGCTINEAYCGPKSTCLPMADNKGKDVLDFRIRRLNVATPPALASDLIQDAIVAHAIDLDDK